MKIYLVGYGKMGKTIERVAVGRGHEICGKLENPVDNLGEVVRAAKADVAIEFTQPDGAADNLLALIEAGVPVVCGTTGWLHAWDRVTEACKANKSALFYASNYSLGVNLFFRLNRALARLMRPFPEYSIALKEIHHTEKRDAPSGTAITLAEGIQKERPEFKRWVNDAVPASSQSKGILGIESFREPNVPGTHNIIYTSAIDQVEIKHTAFSREGFATGAVVAAEWLLGKKGVFGMDDLMGSAEGEKI